jgi:hypothetical protein
MNIIIGLILIGLGLNTLKGTKAFKLAVGIGLLYIGWEALTPIVFTLGTETVVLF